MTSDVGGNERAARRDAQAPTAHVVQGSAGQLRAEALALVGAIDFGVGENDARGPDDLGREAHQPLAETYLVAALLRVVDDARLVMNLPGGLLDISQSKNLPLICDRGPAAAVPLALSRHRGSAL